MKILKIVLAIVLVLILALVGLLTLGYSQLNNLVKAGIERGGTYAMGVETNVASVRLGLLSGTATVAGLSIANPPGYQATKFFTLGEGSISISPASFSQPVIEVPSFKLDTIAVDLERKDGKSNYQVILDNIKKLQDQLGTTTTQPTTPPTTPAPSSADDKKLVINELTIRKVTVKVNMLGVSGGLGDVLNKATKVTIPIDEIKLQNVGKTGTGVGGTGVTVSQLSSIIVQAVLAAAADKGGGLLPTDFLNDLKGNLSSLDGLKGLGLNVLANQTGKVEEIAKDVGQKVEGAVKGAVDNATKGLGEGLKGLIPGTKKDEKKGGG